MDRHNPQIKDTVNGADPAFAAASFVSFGSTLDPYALETKPVVARERNENKYTI
jgi:hypothetical protein